MWVETQRHTEFWCGNLKGGDHLEDLGVDTINVNAKEIRWEGLD